MFGKVVKFGMCGKKVSVGNCVKSGRGVGVCMYRNGRWNGMECRGEEV